MPKLTDLNAQLLIATSRNSWSPTDDAKRAQGIMFLCPKCYTENGGPKGTHRVIIWFLGKDRATPPEMDGPRWSVRGSSLDNLTINPSIHNADDCGWHGWVKNGVAA